VDGRSVHLVQEGYDSVDTDDLRAEWLTRATEAPTFHSFGDVDDPAEIAADSMSMISEASRNAAAFGEQDLDEETDEDERA
jgi:hypothetical protein